MAAKTSWHRYETKLRHCRPMYISRRCLITFPCQRLSWIRRDGATAVGYTAHCSRRSVATASAPDAAARYQSQQTSDPASRLYVSASISDSRQVVGRLAWALDDQLASG